MPEDLHQVNKKHTRLALLQTQVRRLQKKIARLEPRSNRLSWLRVITFFGGITLGIILWIGIGWWYALPAIGICIIIFSILAHCQSQIDNSIARHSLLMHIKNAHIARMQLDWKHIPTTPEQKHPIEEEIKTDHPFEYDLDISGKRSLHQLINTAISREGSERLRAWLLTTQPDLTTIQTRQTLIRELTPLTHFRDRLTMHSLFSMHKTTEEFQGQRLLNWLEKRQPAQQLRPLLWGTVALHLATLILFVLNVFMQMPELWSFTLFITIALFFFTANMRGDISDDATYLKYGLATLSHIFNFLENYRYGNHQQLKTICQPFLQNRAHSPTRLLKIIARIESAATLRNNPFLWLPLNALVPWDLTCAYLLRRYKEQIASSLPLWLETWFELEALCSLATFAYLNPDYTLPIVWSQTHNEQSHNEQSHNEDAHNEQPHNEDALICATNLGHPLIKDEQKVTNNLSIKEMGEIFILTGSNMAGKSTFLRTIGVNLCLAYAGGPVNAQSLQTRLFRLFTCIRITDSVTDGYSYFYAEVKRLRALLDALNQQTQLPLFFLIDEIFKGTNNRERLIGSRSFVCALAGQNCIGAISTHDLELATLEETVPQVKNLHFREEVADGKLSFDYILRTGPCPTTNALTIMALEGLPITNEQF